MATVLVTGAAGYIGSHCCVALHEAGHNVVGVDNFATGSMEQIHQIRSLGGSLPFYEADIRDNDALSLAFQENDIDAVMHFAGLKCVSDSVLNPSEYFSTNVNGTLALITTMKQFAVDRLVFSSSCTVYGDPDHPNKPVNEMTPASPMNPYGRSKLRAEQLIDDLTSYGVLTSAVSLRYFNPVGAHPSGKLTESGTQTPTNLVPVILDVLTGKQRTLTIFGDDYPTKDGTCIRDYLHVLDLVSAHIDALDLMDRTSGFSMFNLGTGEGTSVLEMVAAVEQATGQTVPYTFAARREGDAAALFANASLAKQALGWKATRTLGNMCADHWTAHLAQAEREHIIDVRPGQDSRSDQTRPAQHAV